MALFIDKQSTKEFMLETLSRITLEELEQIQADLHLKSQCVQEMVRQASGGRFSDGTLRQLLRCVFATRRRANKIADRYPADYFARHIQSLLDPGKPVEWRFQEFFHAFPDIEASQRYDLASEILFFSHPDQYWMWTRWMWDPRTRTGSLPLVLMEQVSLEGNSEGEIYRKVGEAVRHLQEIGRTREIPSFLQTAYGVYTYLACVYVIYSYTVLRMRMTQEFNKVMPKLPEFIRRLLGIYRLEELKHAS
ncbi:MAG: hypothetical protein GXO78_01630 [Calditrichaeota bacterium]|nr:hypothetical protein [Calditrichota bacterium]